MERRETFILTLFCGRQPTSELQGRLRHVTTNREKLFSDTEDLIHSLLNFLTQESEKEDWKDEINNP